MNRKAYEKARFRAEEPEDGWPQAFGVVTACNPNGKTISGSANEERTERLEVSLLEVSLLEVSLLEEGLVIFPVTGYDLDSAHEEAGFGVVCGKDGVLRLGREWEQEAVFWVEKGRVWLLSCGADGEEFDLRPLLEMVWSHPCPCCGGGMREGSAAMEHTLGGFLLTGFSALTLFFRGKGAKRLPVLASSNSSAALYCHTCGTLVLKGEDVRARACAKCGHFVPHGRGACGTCGEKFVPRGDVLENFEWE